MALSLSPNNNYLSPQQGPTTLLSPWLVECLSTVGQNKMVTQLQAVPGTSANPGLSFQGHERSGFWVDNSVSTEDELVTSIFGFEVVRIDSSGVVISGNLSVTGTSTLPSIITGLTGYLYGNGGSAVTASTTIPASAITAGSFGSGVFTFSTPPVIGTVSLETDSSTHAASTAWVQGWAGSSSLTTLGTITSGTWHGTAIAASYIGNLPASQITSGTLALARGGTNADNTAVSINTVWAGPGSGSTGNASYRSLVANDLPTFSFSKLTYNINTATTTYSILTTDNYIRCNSSSAFTVTLPVSSGSGICIVLKNIGSAIVTVAGNGADVIDSLASQYLSSYQAIEVVDAATGFWDIKASRL